MWKKPDWEFLEWLQGTVAPRTFRDYMNYYRRIPDAFSLDDVMVLSRQSKWFSNIFKKMAHYMWLKGSITLEDKERIRMAAHRPQRRQMTGKFVDIRQFAITLGMLGRRPDIKALYLVMYYSGARLEEAVHLAQNLDSKEIVELADGTVRVIMSFNRGRKRCEHLYLPREILEQATIAKTTTARAVSSYARDNKLLPPSDVRDLNMQLMKEANVDYAIRNYIQNRVSALTVSERHYEALEAEADREYPRIAAFLRKKLEEAMQHED